MPFLIRGTLIVVVHCNKTDRERVVKTKHWLPSLRPGLADRMSLRALTNTAFNDAYRGKWQVVDCYWGNK